MNIHLRRNPTRRNGFTLVELLAVCAVIAILLSVTFKLAGLTKRVSERKQAVRELEAFKLALAEYHATYGVYPPTKRGDLEERGTDPFLEPPKGRQYGTGLYWHLTRSEGKSRWSRYLAGIGTGGGSPPYTDKVTDPSQPTMPPIDVGWTNKVSYFSDPWGNPYHYEVGQNYQSFLLWSDGVGGEPIGKASFAQ